MKPWILAALLPMASLMAQVPGGWDRREPLASGATPWWGVGLWAADGQGPPATLIKSLGMGNGLTGAGFHLEGGIHAGNWDFAGEVLGNRDFQGAAYLTLYRSHAWWHGPSGWQFGYEQEPLVWGYGLNGGYLLGESDRPVPKLRIESPMRHLGIGRVGLGTWGFHRLDPVKSYRPWSRQAGPLMANRRVFFWQTLRSGVMVYTVPGMPELRSGAELRGLGPGDRLVAMAEDWNRDGLGLDPALRAQFEVILQVPVGGDLALLLRRKDPA